MCGKKSYLSLHWADHARIYIISEVRTSRWVQCLQRPHSPEVTLWGLQVSVNRSDSSVMRTKQVSRRMQMGDVLLLFAAPSSM